MKFGGWTYNGFLMNISQIPVRFSTRIKEQFNSNFEVRPEDKPQLRSYADGREYRYLELGMDLSAYHTLVQGSLSCT